MEARLTLSELNSLVGETLRLSLSEAYWVVAEISELHVAANGHCYLELVEKDRAGRNIKARASAHIWRGNHLLLSRYFARRTGQELAVGLKVLVETEIDFHEIYGYSLNITNIDPTYTLGDLAQQRQEILNRLEKDGVLRLNKELPLPALLRRIAVVSSESAAGYGDFCRQLETSPFRFRTRLFPAIMQGNRLEESVIAALDTIAEEQDQWDAVVIIRGGGAVSDLQGFESYDLAANVAQFPLPVFTGIGHERDDTVIDFVAHTRLKTPTAVAAFLIDHQSRMLDDLTDLETRLLSGVRSRMLEIRREFDSVAHRWHLVTSHFGLRRRENLLRLMAKFQSAAQSHILLCQSQLEQSESRLSAAVLGKIATQKQQLTLFQNILTTADPARILKMGFSITMKGNQVIKSPEQLSEGDIVVTSFESGTVRSKVLPKK